jgi:Protein of unknown function (DUF4232)
MRVIRVVLPAVVAVLVWVASDALAQVAFMSTSPRLRTVLRVIFPDTMSVAAEGPSPWGAAFLVAVSVALAGGYLFFGTLLGPARGIRGFAAAWFAAIAAGTVTVAVPMGAAAIAAASTPAQLVQLAPEPLAAAALWGLVWGWLPALTALLLVDRRGESAERPDAERIDLRRSRRLVLVVAAAVAVLGLGATAILEPSARDAWHAALQAEIPEESAPPAPTGEPVPEVAPGDWQIEPLWCTDNQLEFSASSPDSAAGSRAMSVTAANVSQAPCVLEGYPDLAFSDPVTTALDVRVEHGSAMGADDAGPVRLELAPGATAEATIAWRAMSTAESDREPAGWLHLAPYHGGIRQMMQVETDIIGGDVIVTAWRAGDAG